MKMCYNQPKHNISSVQGTVPPSHNISPLIRPSLSLPGEGERGTELMLTDIFAIP